MQFTRFMVLASLAVVLLGTVGATAALGAEAPYYAIESKRLAAGETLEVTGKQTSEYTLSAGGVVVTCKNSTLNTGEIVGSNAGDPGTGKGSGGFSGCTIANNGTCSIGHNGNQEITPEALKSELVYDAGSKESKSVAVEFTPETGSVLSKITLVGAGCTPVSAGVLAVEGQIVGQAWGGTERATEFLLELGKAPVSAVTGSVRFPATRISSIILILKGVATQKTVGLTLAGKATKLIGESEGKLVSGKKGAIIS